jgi:hypothetical protein|tara:strand:+ start:865 stop:1098 length:234 start_codon:yes stop_codon:yes gene_type:complete
MANNNPVVIRYMAYHTGGVPKTVEASTPAEIAEKEGFGIDDNQVAIFVGGKSATPNTRLKEGQVVSFQKARQESGNK